MGQFSVIISDPPGSVLGATQHAGLDGNDTLYGLGGADNLLGAGGNDQLNGGDGQDTLNGGTGADTMTGGQGDDTYTIDNVGDVVVEAAGEGKDTVITTVDTTLADNVEVLQFAGVGNWTGTGNASANAMSGLVGNDTLIGLAGNDSLYGGAGNDSLSGGDDQDSLVGGAGDDTLLGGLGLDFLDGGDGADSLDGGAGNDSFYGGAGNNTLTGGAGDDFYVITSATDTVVELSGEGNDSINTAVDLVLAANVEALNYTGTGNWTGTGNALANYIYGNVGNDTIHAGAGDDYVSSGAGDDTVYGEDGADVLQLGIGNDYAYGGAGADTITGGGGADTMEGGAGDDTYYVDNGGDQVIELAGEGIDTIFTTVNLTLAANVEKLLFNGTGNWTGTGNALDNYLSGGDGNDTMEGLGGNDKLYGAAGADHISGGDGADTINGGAGADTMVGGLGDDSYYVDTLGDVVTEAAGEGIDTIFTTINLTLGANVEKMIYNGSTAWTATGNELGNYFAAGDTNDTIYGLGGDDVIYGLGGQDQLYGGDGNDMMNGGAGADTMTGGLGNDTYYVDNAGDVVVEAAGEGKDTVFATVSTTLGANLESLIFNGTGNWSGTGNADANYVAGGAGNDTLNGGGGADTLVGGLGADTFVFASVAEIGAGETISDFNRSQGDLLDLSAIDANTLTAGDDAFAWIGNAAFSHTAGELRYELVSGNVVVSGDVDGDGVADFAITLKGVTGETPADGGMILLGANTIDWHDFVM